MNNNPKRRIFLLCVATGVVVLTALWSASSRSDHTAAQDEPVAFFLIGDTHLQVSKGDPDKLDERSASLCAGLVNALNKLPGTEIPKTAGGGTVLTARGVIHAGDCIQRVEPLDAKKQQTEWSTFTAEFGLNGKDGRLKLPIYEIHGNHDNGLPVQQIMERNKTRSLVTNTSKNGLHYSWDWGHVHFINLGVSVGPVEEVKRKRRYDPLGSLEFLIADLKAKVGDTGKAVVITHHIDMLSYSQPLPIEDKKAELLSWDPADVKAFHQALRGYNIVAILYGHTHSRNVFKWDGTAKPAKTGIQVFNVTKSSHFSSLAQGLFYLEIRGNTVTAREYQTKDGWKTGEWTPKSWSATAGKS